MGIYYDSKLIYGWSVDSFLLKEFLIKNKAGTCDGYYEDEEEAKTAAPTSIIKLGDPKTYDMQCTCVDCWKNLKLPDGIYFEVTEPYYDCELDDRKYFITLNINASMNREEFLAISDETIAAGQALAEKLNIPGKALKEPTISSELHIT